MSRLEKSLSGWEKLDPVSQAYLSELSQVRGTFTVDKIAKRIPLLLSHESSLSRIRVILEELKGFAKKPDTVRNPRVKKGWSVLMPFVKDISSALIKRDASLFVYGSLLYDDPQNLDYDVMIVTKEYDDVLNTLVDYLWQDKLDEQWRSVGTSGNLSYLALSTLENHAHQLAGGSTSYARSLADEIHSSFAASEVLTGYPVVAPDTHQGKDAKASPLIKGLRQRVFDICEQSPIIAAEVCLDLEECVQIRKQRASRSD